MNNQQHLQDRFKTRFNIILTKQMRISFLYQIYQNKSQKCHTWFDRKGEKKEIHKVNYNNQSFDIIYSPSKKSILTVLPPLNSKEFLEFAKKMEKENGISIETLVFRRKTAKEIEIEDNQQRIQKMIEKNKIKSEIDACYNWYDRVNLGKKRLNNYLTSINLKKVLISNS